MTPIIVGGLALAAALYAGGVHRLSRRQVDWSPARTTSFASGLAVIALALASPIAELDEDVRVHMLQHLLLGMLAPLLLALSAPGTLLLRALPRHRRARVARVIHCRAARVIAHPCITAGLATGSLYALYFTPLYQATLESEPLHASVHVHTLATGCLLAWAIVGLDPLPYRPAFPLRSAALLSALAAHAILGRLLDIHAGSLATSTSPADAWRQAAQLLFYGGDLIGLGLLAAFFSQWYAHEGRRLERRRGASRRAEPAYRG
jgi:putative membrane protein